MTTIFVPEDFYCPITGELMNDPVSEPDGGHTYERSAIEKWIMKNGTSPMTRKILGVDDLKSNIILKKSIDSIREKISEEQLKIESRIVDSEMKEFTDTLKDTTIKASQKDNNLLIEVDVPNVDKRPPVDIVLCIDVSGSMGTDAPVKGNDGSSTSYGINVLSLTVAASKTILKTLTEEDNISIVTYTDKADTLFTDCPCTEQNKSTIESELDRLVPLNTTNIWDGLKTSLDILRLNSPPNKMKVIKLLTDGVPNVEPSRGHEYELNKYFKTHDFKCMINCYGFGYSLKSDLLDNISKISGGDGYSFIPDSSLLGNVFIHGISNFFTTAAINVKLNILCEDGGILEDIVDSIKYGRSKNIILEVDKSVKKVELIHNGMKFSTELYEMIDEYYYEQIYRCKVVKCINNCIKMKKFNDERFKTELDNLILEISFNKEVKDSEYIKNILFDLEGQVKEALNMTTEGHKKDFFTRWGIHYLRSLKTAYENEICNNFKDKGVSNFTGVLFDKLRDEVSDIFDNMPPPKRTERTVYGSSGMRGGGGVQPLQPLATMASYNMPSGGCCAPGSMVKMGDGCLKPVEHIKKGDEVVTVISKNGIDYIDSGIIECVVMTECFGGFQHMISLKGITGNKLNITPYHPVIKPGSKEWIYPNDIGEVEIIRCPEMYTFVVSNRKSIIVEDYIFATYGHGLSDNFVIQHDFFGTDLVINDLKNIVSYKLGKVYLTDNMFQRNDSGDVCKIGFEWKYIDFVNIMYNSKL